jgi:hypothetical protein
MTSGLRGPSGSYVVSGLKGKTHGGQFPVTGSTVQVYAVSAAGAGYAAQTAALGTSVTTDAGGNWSYGDFTCTSQSDELYVVSTGGNPGLGGNVNNPGLAMTAALGPCSGVDSIPFVFIDEVTTVATVYSLAGFSTDYLHIGTSSTNTVGLSNAFATVNNLVDITTGQALTTTPGYASAPANSTNDTFRSIVPYDLINTLANIIASCVNTDGVSNPACANLFQITGGSLASPAVSVTNTADAVLYIAHHPGLPSSTSFSQTNSANLFALSTASAPFGPALTTNPNDYTMTVNFVGGGLGGVKATSTSAAQRLAIDQSGDLWVPNPARGTVTELSNLGVPLSPSTTINTSTLAYRPIVVGGFTGGLSNPNHIAIDLSGNAWVSDGVSCLGAFSQSGTPLSGSPYSVCPTSSGPAAGVAVDAANNIWIETESSITEVSNSAAPIFQQTSGFDVLNSFLGPDYTGHMWFIDSGNGHYGAFTSSGSLYTETNTVLPYASNGWTAMGPLATSAGGNNGLAMWITQADGVENIQPALLTGGSAIDTFPNAILPDTEAVPGGIAVDGSGYYYFSNTGGANGTNEIPANITVYTSADGQVSTNAEGYVGGSALTALEIPNAVGVDQSGNLWVLNQNNYNNNESAPAGGTYLGNGVNAANLTEFVGLGSPVNPVFAQDAANGTYGAKP